MPDISTARRVRRRTLSEILAPAPESRRAEVTE